MCYGPEFERAQHGYESDFCGDQQEIEAWVLMNRRALSPLLMRPLREALGLVSAQ